MFRTRYLVLLAAGAALCWMVGAQARADTLMLDNFDSATEVDINTGIGSPRQTGTLVPGGGITYTKVAQNGGTLGVWNTNGASGPHEPELILWNHGNGTTHGVWQDQNETTLVGTHYQAGVHMDFDAGMTGWAFVAVSESQDSLSGYLPRTGIVADVNPAGEWELFLGGVGGTAITGTTTAAQSYNVAIDINEVGGATHASLIVNGSTVTSAQGPFTWDSGNRYLGIGGLMNQRTTMWFNDLRLDPAPEPSSMVLIASSALGLLAYAWRKRR
jgi:hypothetical protein